jgi:4,4'-diaponeurosporenoate glycosyltransferase
MLPELFCGGGLVAGFLLLRSVPLVPQHSFSDGAEFEVTVIIPVRNEELNLPILLESLSNAPKHSIEILVVNDGSTDATATIATQYGATVLTSMPVPQGWTGKTWACHQGAHSASGEILFFLDADTYFVHGGYGRILQYFATLPDNAALSLLPFHRTKFWYEELSLFFNILMAMGAGGFGRLDRPRLFGQSLLIRKDMYHRAGGHEDVRSHILENLNFASCVSSAGGHVHTLGGNGTLEIRMFPRGFRQLLESWQKAFVAGAEVTSRLVLGLSIGWLASAIASFLLLFVAPRPFRTLYVCVYVLYAAQIAWFARQLGTFRWLTALCYPMSLIFYFGVFGHSLWRKLVGKPVYWRGRRL